MVKHFISIKDFSKEEITKIFELAIVLKKELKEEGSNKELLKNKTLAMIFEKPSLRTRVSFEAGMTQLGGHAIFLGPNDIQMGKRESPTDVARNLERMTDVIMARVFEHKKLEELSKDATVPVINALSDSEHPCQAMADLLTVYEKKGKLEGLKLSFVGDGNNNVTHSLALISDSLDINFSCAHPEGYEMNKKVVSKMKNRPLETNSVEEAVKGSDIVVTDTWVSMGDEDEKEKRLKVFPPYQVDEKVMNYAKEDAIFMHCLPAYRGYEVSEDVIDGDQSVVYDEAENRLHVQKAIILYLLGISY